MAEAAPALEIRNLHKRYGQLEVLKGISLTARDGDVISILGSSGSGKSTFLRCINLLENPHQGQILVAGEELKLKAAKNGELVAADSKQINRLRSEIGFVFQNFNLWPHMSVLDNIIEAPAACSAKARPKPSKSPKPCWPRSALPTSATPTPRNSPVVSNNARPSPAHWRCSPR